MSDNEVKERAGSRRSSILKPPKPRNPLSDVEMKAPTEASRRVSFANVHCKKEFTADPEVNTIWHNSYEEEIRATTSSTCSDLEMTEALPGILLEKSMISMTSDLEFTETIPAILEKSMVLNQYSEDMDLTEALSTNIIKENETVDVIQSLDMEITGIFKDPSIINIDKIEDESLINDSTATFVSSDSSKECNNNLLDEIEDKLRLLKKMSQKYSDYDLNEDLKKKSRTYEVSAETKEMQQLFDTISKSKKPFKLKLTPPTAVSDLDETKDFQDCPVDLFQIRLQMAKTKKSSEKYEMIKKRRQQEHEERAEKEKAEKPKKLTIQENILQMKNKDSCWNLIPNSEYNFTHVYDNIKFEVRLEPQSEIVKTVHFLVDDSGFTPIGLYIYSQNEKTKFTEEEIKKDLGEQYTIYDLLKYVTKISKESDKCIKEYKYLERKVGMVVDSNQNATLSFTNSHLRIAFEITFNLNCLNNMTPASIVINNLVKKVDENAIKNLIGSCPPGYGFIREFNTSVKNYLRKLEKDERSN